MHSRIWKRALTLVISALAGVVGAVHAANVTTHHYDTLRTGWNPAETVLTPAAVSGASFQLSTTVMLDEQVDAQPLLLQGQSIPGLGIHDVVYVATEGDTVYGIDAATGAILLSRSLGTPVPYTALPDGSVQMVSGNRKTLVSR